MERLPDKMPTILVIGGTGHFGGRICRRLARVDDLKLIITSRSADRARDAVRDIHSTGAGTVLDAAAIDLDADTLEEDLRTLAPDVVIHTAGPFQGQSFGVAEACIAAGVHYLDLADGREFVTNIDRLHGAAEAAGVTVVSGVSTLPGVSSAAIESMKDEFAQIHSIEMSIAPAHKTPRGVSTVKAVLGYCGQPFTTWRDGAWRTVYGWQDLRAQRYPSLGRRMSGACDVPDLELLPRYIPDIQSVSFHAALEAPWEQLALWLMAGLTRMRLVRDWSRFTSVFRAVAERTLFLGSTKGGMHLKMFGVDHNGRVISRAWYLVAESNHGPEIPCTPAILLAKKLIGGSFTRHGAFPCLGLFTIDEVLEEMREFHIAVHKESGG